MIATTSEERGGEKKKKMPSIIVTVIQQFYTWQEVAYLCLHQWKSPGEHSAQNPQEEFGHTFQSSLVFKNPPSLKGKHLDNQLVV